MFLLTVAFAILALLGPMAVALGDAPWFIAPLTVAIGGGMTYVSGGFA